MVCQKCKQKEASVFVSKIINNQKSEVYLCDNCAKVESDFEAINIGNMFDFNIGDLLDQMMFEKNDYPVIEVKTCPNCGMTLNEFSKIGKLGCSNCYNTFSNELLPLFKRIHGSTTHNGKLPIGTEHYIIAKREIEELKVKLGDSIASERYEDAAKYRDRIKELEIKQKEA